MIHGDTVLQDQSGCDLLTGALKMRTDPLTGEAVPWKWTRNYGCNTPAASEHLLTFRSGAAGLFRSVQRRRHRQLRRLPLQLHQQPHRRRRPPHRPRIHPHLHLPVPEPNLHRPHAHARRGDVDLLRHQGNQGPRQAARHHPRRPRRPQGRRRHALARISEHRRRLPGGANRDNAQVAEVFRRHSSAVTGPYNWVTSLRHEKRQRNLHFARHNVKAAAVHGQALFRRARQDRSPANASFTSTSARSES